jgi:hypothetical protein
LRKEKVERKARRRENAVLRDRLEAELTQEKLQQLFKVPNYNRVQHGSS